MATQKRYIMPAIIFILLMGFLLVYLILVHPFERAELLSARDEEMSDIIITIQNNKFTPSEIEIYSGNIVLWINRGNEKHRINGVGFQSSVLNPGGKYSHRFVERGTFVYSCEFNPEMRGIITVK